MQGDLLTASQLPGAMQRSILTALAGHGQHSRTYLLNPTVLLTQFSEAVLHEFHLLLPLLAAQASHHYALAGGDLLVTSVH